MSKKEIHEAQGKSMRFFGILSAILLHAGLVSNDFFLVGFGGIFLVSFVVLEMYAFENLMRAIKRRR